MGGGTELKNITNTLCTICVHKNGKTPLNKIVMPQLQIGNKIPISDLSNVQKSSETSIKHGNTKYVIPAMLKQSIK